MPSKRADQGRHEQPGDAAVHTVGDPRIVSLDELEAEVRMSQRVAQAGQQLPVVVDDVAIVQRDDVAVAAGKQMAVRQPAGSAFAVRARGKSALFQPPEQALNSLAVHPDEVDRCIEIPEELLGSKKLLLRRPANGHDDSLQVADLLQFRHDPLHRQSLELRVERRQDQPDRAIAAELLQIRFQPLNMVLRQPVQSCDCAGLIEIGHCVHLPSRA